VIALEASQFHVAEAATLLAHDPIAVLYVATVLAHRLDGANHTLIQLKGQLRPASRTASWSKPVSRMEAFLAVSDASLIYAGYPTNPCA